MEQQSLIEDQDREILLSKATINEITLQVEDLQGRKDALIVKMDQISGQNAIVVEALVGESDQLRLDGYALENDYTVVFNENAALKDNVTKHSNEIEELVAHVTALEETQKSIQNEKVSLEFQIQEKESEKQALITECNKKDTFISDLESTVNTLELQLKDAANISENVLRLNKELESATIKLSELLSNYDGLDIEKKILEEHLLELELGLEATSKLLLNEQTSSKKLKESIEKYKSQQLTSDEEMLNLNDRFLILKDKLQTTQMTKTEIGNTKSHDSTLLATNIELQATVDTLKRDLQIVGKIMEKMKLEQQALLNSSFSNQRSSPDRDYSFANSSPNRVNNESSQINTHNASQLRISHKLNKEQFTEIQYLKEALFQITTFVPGNSYDHALKRVQNQLEEMRKVWSNELSANTSLRSLVYESQRYVKELEGAGVNECSYVDLRQEFDNLVGMYEEKLAEIAELSQRS